MACSFVHIFMGRGAFSSGNGMDSVNVKVNVKVKVEVEVCGHWAYLAHRPRYHNSFSGIN